MQQYRYDVEPPLFMPNAINISGSLGNHTFLSPRYFYILYWHTILLFVFLIGGSLQILGLVSNTELSSIVVIAIFLVTFVFSILSGKLVGGVFYLFGFVGATWIVFVGLLHDVGYVYVIASLTCIVFPLASVIFVSSIRKYANPNHLYKLLLLISLLQLPAILIQRYFFENLALRATDNISLIDAGFGTFFLKADHSLCFFLLCLITLSLFKKNSGFRGMQKLFWVGLWSITILATNSKMAIILLSAIALVVICKYCIRLRVLRTALPILLLLGLPFVIIIVLEYDLYASYSEFISLKYQLVADKAIVPRWGPLVIFLHEPIAWFGHGGFAYYNPIDKEWVFMGGHSAFYSTYYDYGLIGLALFYIGLFVMVIKNKKRNNGRLFIVYIGMFTAFSFVTNSLLNLDMLITLSIFIYFSDSFCNQKFRLVKWLDVPKKRLKC